MPPTPLTCKIIHDRSSGKRKGQKQSSLRNGGEAGRPTAVSTWRAKAISEHDEQTLALWLSDPSILKDKTFILPTLPTFPPTPPPPPPLTLPPPQTSNCRIHHLTEQLLSVGLFTGQDSNGKDRFRVRNMSLCERSGANTKAIKTMHNATACVLTAQRLPGSQSPEHFKQWERHNSSPRAKTKTKSEERPPCFPQELKHSEGAKEALIRTKPSHYAMVHVHNY